MNEPSDNALTLDEDAVYPNPRDAEESLDRRHFLALAGASAALAGASGCSPRPASHGEIVPYVRDAEGLTPGAALTFATAMELNGSGLGLLATSREGRPIKLEGNPDHAGSLGSSDLFSQAAILGLYDPDRSKQMLHRGAPASWTDARAALRSVVDQERKRKGAGLRILSGRSTSPTLAALRHRFLEQFPQARWLGYEPCGRDAAWEGSRQAFGEPVHSVSDFKSADVVLSLDCDFLACQPGTVRDQRDFAERRRVRMQGGGVAPARMNRLYVVESMLSVTGANADHRLAVKPSEVEAFARALAAELGIGGVAQRGSLTDAARAWIAPLAADLKKQKGRSLVLAGDSQPPGVHALGHAMNHTLGNIGATLHFTEWLEAAVDGGAALRELATELASGAVSLLLILDSNPLYTAPADIAFAEALARVPHSVHLGLHRDETAAVCRWHFPEKHFLESWGDARGRDGTVVLQQPLIEPLNGGRSAIELLTALFQTEERTDREMVREYWRGQHGDSGFDDWWRAAVQRGTIADSALPEKKATWRGWVEKKPAATAEPPLEIQFLPDPTLFDGRFANNGWLQELPKPVTKLTWDNAAIVSPATAAQLHLAQSPDHHGGHHGGIDTDVVELRLGGRSVRAPVLILPGHADGAVTVHLGHGRTHAGTVGTGVGFDAYRLRSTAAPGFVGGVEIARTGDRTTLACTQSHHSMEGRDPVQQTTAAEFAREPHFIKRELDTAAEKAAVTALPPAGSSTPPPAAEREPRLFPLSMYEDWPYTGRQWGMAIDLSTCTGCSACVVACQAENNIPVVGKDQVVRSREMHWIRIDRYAKGERQFFQPVPCQQCENAPCEYVCPVGATVHSHDGLNDMTYNRCVGTRYCSNNCPYKVRRFNFLAFADFSTEALKPLRNPEVTVRSRGVMEKCTYCVQRIRGAEIASEVSGQAIADGTIQTACQQACPSQAIHFGDINERGSGVQKWKSEPHNYSLLGELNTRPRTTYLAAIRNPNPEMPGGA